MIDLHLPVEGMSCGGCVNSVQKALMALPGVEEAVASLESRCVDVRYDPSRATREQLVDAIERAGFDVPDASA
ncbi:MAG: copper chaperone [Deltaproteobacteria bacterium]|nr:MAG: copper chaperone [Deltaproteobacteria bacterium]